MEYLLSGDTNIKAYSTDWSTQAILEYYLKRDLTQIEKDETIAKEFKQKDWKEFNDEQIILKNNLIIICLY